MRLVISGGRIVDPSQSIDDFLDIALEDGLVAEIGTGLTGDVVRDVAGCVVSPGLVDIHVHLREPGFEYKETIATGTEAAVAGGFTSVVAMPNTDPVPDTGAAVHGMLKKAEGAQCRVYTLGTITRGRSGNGLSEMWELIEAGVVGFSDDGDPVADSGLMRRALEYSTMFDKPVSVHAEDRRLSGDGQMHEGAVSTELGIPGIPSVAWEVIVARDIILAQYTGGRLHLMHLSTAGEVKLLRDAKISGASVTGETAPHYFTLTHESVRNFDTNAKMSPPLRTQEDVEAILEGLVDGTIDAIATDHAPHAVQEKDVEFAAAPFGIVGLETSLGLSWTALVKTGLLTPSQLIQKMSTAPTKICGLTGGTLSVGSPADITVIDPERTWTVDPSTFRSKGKNTPFGGRELTGKAVLTIVEGEIRFDELS